VVVDYTGKILIAKMSSSAARINESNAVLKMKLRCSKEDDELTEYFIRFYDAIELPPHRKSYDIKRTVEGMDYIANFHTSIDNYADLFTSEALSFLDEVANSCANSTFYVEAELDDGTYEPILTHYITVSKEGCEAVFGNA
jgi:hypothetical protein